MAIPNKHEDKYLYHFTHIENLESIVKNGFLSTNEKDRLAIDHKDVANDNIQLRRHNMKVPVGPGGTVHDYVPFYFCTRNPMLLSLVLSKNIDQMFMIFFAVPIKKILEETVLYTDASANTASPPTFYGEVKDIDKLNWDLILLQTWMPKTNIEKHQKMAEALVYKSMPISDVETIIVWNPSMKQAVEDIFKNNNVKCPNVITEPFKKKNFYFTKWAMGRETETFTTGPFWLKKYLKDQIKNIEKSKAGKKEAEYPFKNIEELLNAIDNEFCIIRELKGIFELETENEIHIENVSDHTLSVVTNLVDSKCYKAFDDENKVILKLSAYLHDIGKGPHEKWKNKKQPPFLDHPVDSLKMTERVLIEEVEEISKYEIRMICLLVGYHDLIGEIFGKGRDKQQLFDILKTEEEFDILNCLSHADIKSFDNDWQLGYGMKSARLKKEFLEQLGK